MVNAPPRSHTINPLSTLFPVEDNALVVAGQATLNVEQPGVASGAKALVRPDQCNGFQVFAGCATVWS
jgi:hypothetical protein